MEKEVSRTIYDRECLQAIVVFERLQRREDTRLESLALIGGCCCEIGIEQAALRECCGVFFCFLPDNGNGGCFFLGDGLYGGNGTWCCNRDRSQEDPGGYRDQCPTHRVCRFLKARAERRPVVVFGGYCMAGALRNIEDLVTLPVFLA